VRLGSWLRWAAINLAILAGVMVAGLVLLVPAALAGWGDADSRHITYLYLWVLLPLTAPLYLLALALIAPRVANPRVWAVALTVLLWAAFPVAAGGLEAPAIVATWIAYLTFGALVRLPPPVSRPASAATSP